MYDGSIIICDQSQTLEWYHGSNDKCMIVLVKNLYTVHILIWLTQIRNQHHLWWRSTAYLDTARRSTSRHHCQVLWRRAALRNHSLLTPECAFWAGPPTPKTPKPQNIQTPTSTQQTTHTPIYIYILALSLVLNTLLLLINLSKSMDTHIKSCRRLYQVIGLYVLMCTHSDALACNCSHIYYICHHLLALVCR